MLSSLVPTADRSQVRRFPLSQLLGRPRIEAEVEALVVRFARDNRSWGYDRMVGALANLGHVLSVQTVGNILRRYGIAPAPEPNDDLERVHPAA
jgi:putative transposase